MATWNVRVLMDKHHAGLYEVHYDDAGNVRAYTSDPTVVGENMDDLRGEVLNLILALDTAPLDLKAVNKAVHAKGKPIHAGPRSSALKQLEALDRVTERLRERLRERLASRALEDGVEQL